ncbi:Asp-tRNA(Asn)/Glu-tRNA(Gln) amidotransferase subunit GatB [archaeon]|jgi:aspartyl-tRNA(Asn)/glutamyl-tRNA(Gln) amidotransferase subunit B|nr:Asp-tRNA(Asn)/Glu-tRNA(Gln) amidotransferase subunit GatB [archaeon]
MKNNIMIGLEIHGYLDTKEKLFCNCENMHDMKKIKPNTNICPICTGQPGSKPQLPNKEAINKILQIALMLNCKPNITPKNLTFQRKHYNWPDMPTGFQKTISGAHSDHVANNGNFQQINITEIHLEEDPAAWNPDKGTVDYNRAGAPLVEIVTEPEFTSAEQVESWLKKLVLTLSYIKALNKDAGIKADVNVSIKNLSVRSETKNVNSITEIKKVIKSEIERHLKEKPKSMETRRWNTTENITTLMRSKENQADYRFIPEPDLPSIKITNQRIQDLKKQLPESPMDKLDKIIKKHKINKTDAEILTQNIDIAELFENIIEKVEPRFALPWITIEWFGVLNYNKKTMDDIETKVEHFIELLTSIQKGKITPLKGKEILRKFIPKSFSTKQEIKNSSKITNKDELKKIILKILKNNPKAVEDYKNKETQALNFLMGQIMKETDRRADFVIARKVLEEELK